MRIISKLAFAAVMLGAFTASASAAVNFTSPYPYDTHGYGPGEALVWNFDGVANSHFTYTGGVYSSSSPNWVAAPAGDNTNFGAAEPVGPFTDATFALKSGEFNSLSFYLGSLDSYNTISFYNGSTLVQSFSGDQLTIPNPADGNQGAGDTNRRYFFTFGSTDDVNKVVFSSSAPAFEFDNFAASVSGVPEPATWAMMILGFGFVGFMARAGRRQKVQAIA